MELELQWIESNGGPLLAAEASLLPLWTGYQGDYDLACAVPGLVGRIVARGHRAIVLTDQPAMTTWLPDGRMFVRWMHGDPSSDVRAVVSGSGPNLDWHDEFSIELHEDLVLFDAASPGRSLCEHEILPIGIEPGPWVVRTAELRPDAATWFRVHQLVADLRATDDES